MSRDRSPKRDTPWKNAPDQVRKAPQEDLLPSAPTKRPQGPDLPPPGPQAPVSRQVGPPGQPNPAVALRNRLLALSRLQKEDFQLVLNRYAMERFLHRLGESQHRDTTLLKGAALFLAWGGHPHRRTRDIDLLAHGDPSVPAVTQLIREICEVPADDGMVFDPASLAGTTIRKGGLYGGVRVHLSGYLAGARARLHADVGSGDIVLPAPEEITFPTLLDLPPPRVRAYSQETVIAEKVHAIVLHEMENSRLKDHFDIWHLSRMFPFDGPRLQAAIHGTFERRRTALPEEVPVGMTKAFSSSPDKLKTWHTYTKKAEILGSPLLDQVVQAVQEFVWPILAPGSSADKDWQGRWIDRSDLLEV